MKFTKEIKRFMEPISAIQPEDIKIFEEATKDMPFSLSEILKRNDIMSLVFDRGFVSFKVKNNECIVYAYYVSKKSKISSKEHRKAFYDFLKYNGCKSMRAYTHTPPKVWKNWGFKLQRYEIVRKL
tara:strand:+ start:19137 stop:19514 length:378 start_codon:yes stop_codon:yes gene_type:complete